MAIYEIIVENLENGGYFFNAKKANKAINFIENFCHHCEGREDLITLELWQKSMVLVIFGIIDAVEKACTDKYKLKDFSSCYAVEGMPYLRYTFANGQRAAIEFSKVGVMTQFQYNDDFFGSDNSALKPTMQLIHTQNQGIINGVKNSANIRFLAKIANVLKPEDIKKERDRFTEENLSSENHSGMIVYDGKFADLKQVDSKPFVINPLQMKQIYDNVYNYFGTNEAIQQNKYDENTWNAYYEGKLEPFAIQLSLVMSNMTFTQRELSFNNSITWTTNRLQYASNNTKLQISTQLFDRGLLNRNGVMDIWNMAHVEDGDKYYIRREYAEVGKLGGEEDIQQHGIQAAEPSVDNTAE